MPTIIEQIQRDSLDPLIPVSYLLRRVKLAAAKLGLNEVEQWVNSELNGYDEEVPDYRVLRGQPKAWNSYRGWLPLGGSVVEILSKKGVGQSIAALEDLLARPDEGEMHISISPELTKELDKAANIPSGRYAVFIDRSQVVGVIDKVRNQVLDWAINLEKSGVVGSEFSFTQEEKSKAQRTAMTFNIHSIGSFNGNIGSGNTTGDISNGSINVHQTRDLVEEIQRHKGELIAVGVPADALSDKLSLLRNECEKASPDQGVLRGLLTDTRNLVTSAGGNLVSTGVLAAINLILGTGVPAP